MGERPSSWADCFNSAIPLNPRSQNLWTLSSPQDPTLALVAQRRNAFSKVTWCTEPGLACDLDSVLGGDTLVLTLFFTSVRCQVGCSWLHHEQVRSLPNIPVLRDEVWCGQCLGARRQGLRLVGLTHHRAEEPEPRAPGGSW